MYPIAHDADSPLKIKIINQDLSVPIAHYTLFFKADFLTEPVTDLSQEAVTITDNGTILEYESGKSFYPDPQSFGFDILLLVDLSQSITEANALPVVKSSLINFVETLIPENSASSEGTNIALYYYDGDPTIWPICSYTRNREVLLTAIDDISPELTRDGSTNLYGAAVSGAEAIKNQLARSNKTAKAGALILFTDGTDLAGLKNLSEATYAVNSLSSLPDQVDVYTIGLGDDIDEPVLNDLGTDGFYFANDLENLSSTFESIATELLAEVNSYYKLEYCSPRRAGFTSLEFNINYQNSSTVVESCINSTCTPDQCP